jgi:hypothetical protein
MEERRVPQIAAHTNGHPAHDHERRDVPIGLITKFLIGLAVSLIVSAVALIGMWRVFAWITPEEPSLAEWMGGRELPPAPRLQVTPGVALDDYLTAERQRLATFGWVDKASGRVRIPIDQAMDLVVKDALPARKTAPPPSPAPRDAQPKTGPGMLTPLYTPSWETSASAPGNPQQPEQKGPAR